MITKRPVILTVILLVHAALGAGISPSHGSTKFDPSPFLGTRWYGVYLMGNKVGYGSFRLAQSAYRSMTSYTSDFSVFYRVNIGGSFREMSIEEEKIYLPDEGLVAFSAAHDSILGHISLTGKKVDDRFEVTTSTDRQSVPAGEEKLADALADLILVREKSPPGRTIEGIQFETTLLAPVKMIHTVDSIEKRFINGVPTELYRIRSDFPALGISTVSLIDENLHTLESKVGAITIREEGEEEAKNTGYSSDLLLITSVHPARVVPHPRRVVELTMRLGGIEDPALLLSSPRQQFTRIAPDTYYLTIRKEEEGSVSPRQLPVMDPLLKPFLKSTAYIQSNHPSIRVLAREIVGDEKNSRRVAALLSEWVYSNLEKSFLVAIPNAVDILKKRAGDCKAHSILFVALARCLGLPARTVAGLVAMEDGAFYFHQWAEVNTGRWLTVDPVFDQVAVDATHIKLSEGDLIDQVRLINVIGAISIDVMDYKTEE